MLNREMKEYLNSEIPQLSRYKGFLRFIMLLRIRYNQPSYDAVYMFRYCLLFSQSRSIIKKQLCRRYKRLLVRRYGFYFSTTEKTKVGKGVFFPHPSSIIIGADVSIGENCVIYQNVTVGGARIGDAAKSNYPKIGNDCILFAGCKVLGDIELGDKTTVGANAVLLKSTETGSTYAGVPAKKIR